MNAQKQPGLPITIYAKESFSPVFVKLVAGISFQASQVFEKSSIATSQDRIPYAVQDLVNALTSDIYRPVLGWVRDQRNVVMCEYENTHGELTTFVDKSKALADLEKRIRSLANVTLDESVKKVLGEYLRPK